MPTDIIQAKYEDLENIAVRFGQWAERNTAMGHRLRQSVEKLIHGGWAGQGAEVFFKEMSSEVLPATERLSAALEQSQGVLRQVMSILRQAEEEAAALFHDDHSIPTNTNPDNAEAMDNSRSMTNKGLAAQQSQRDKAKRAAADAAVAMNDAAALLTGASVIAFVAGAATGFTGFGGLAGVGVGGVLGVCAAAAWWSGNRYQKLANDPPRDDFYLVSRFEPQKFNFAPPTSAFEATWQIFSQQQIMLANAVHDLVTSLERYDGGHIANALAAIEIQNVAIMHNATVCAQLIDDVIALMPQVNTLWKEYVQTLHIRDEAVMPISGEEHQRKLSTFWQSTHLALQDQLQLDELDILAFQQFTDEFTPTSTLSADWSDVLLNEQWGEVMRMMAEEMRSLAAAHARI